jgi:hypothetical protein
MSSCRSVDGGQRPGTTSAELAEIKSLKATVRRLEEDNAILKAAAVFFASTRPPQPLMMGFIDQMRAEGFAVESICRVLREQGCQVAARDLVTASGVAPDMLIDTDHLHVVDTHLPQ